jgi:hypothetical protein
MQTDHSLTQRWLFPLSAWWGTQRRLLCLGSAQERERKDAVDWFMAQGADGLPALRRGLRYSVGVACGAAGTLYRLGDPQGVRAVLIRCYEEEWLSRCLQCGHIGELRALRRLGYRTVAATLTAALDDAEREREEHLCLGALVVSLSALRVLAVFEEETPAALLVRTLRFGPATLRGPGNSAAHGPTAEMTTWIRMEAISRLLQQHPTTGPDLLIAALRDPDRHVVATAIDGLILLRCRQALSYLQSIAFHKGHPEAAHARRAIACIAGSQADALILMRAAGAPLQPDELLRPAAPHTVGYERQSLVCPVSPSI